MAWENPFQPIWNQQKIMHCLIPHTYFAEKNVLAHISTVRKFWMHVLNNCTFSDFLQISLNPILNTIKFWKLKACKLSKVKARNLLPPPPPSLNLQALIAAQRLFGS